MKKIVYTLLGISLATLWILNFSAGIIGGVWLGLTGGLGLVVIGLVYSFVMPWGYAIAFLPTMLLAPLLVKSIEGRSRFFTTVLGLIMGGYQYFLLALWVVMIFGWFISESGYSFVALLLWGYSVVMGPIGYMASKEGPDSTGTTFGVLFTQVCYLVLAINFLLGGSPDVGYGLVWLLLLIFVVFLVFVVNLYIPPKGEQEIPPVLEETYKKHSYFTKLFRGRLNRRNYLAGNIFLYLFIILLAYLLSDWFYYVVTYTISIVYGLSFNIRRLHDFGKSGWLILLGFIPLVNLLFLLWLFVWRGEKEDNKFGETPEATFSIKELLAITG